MNEITETAHAMEDCKAAILKHLPALGVNGCPMHISIVSHGYKPGGWIVFTYYRSDRNASETMAIREREIA